MKKAYFGIKSLKKHMIANGILTLISLVSIISIIYLWASVGRILHNKSLNWYEFVFITITLAIIVGIAFITTRVIAIVCCVRWANIRSSLLTEEPEIIALPWFIKRLRFYLLLEIFFPSIFSWILFFRLKNLNGYLNKELEKANKTKVKNEPIIGEKISA